MDKSKLKSYLECPICLTLPRSKIFCCVNSHKICETCYSKMAQGLCGKKLCPQGGCKYDKPPRRVRDCEAMIENSGLELSCNRPGCTVEMKKDEMLKHEVGCEFRTVPCPSTNCQMKVLFKDIDFHIQQNHKSKNKEIKKKSPRMSLYLKKREKTKGGFRAWKLDWTLYYRTQDGLQFYPQFVKRKGIWYFWVKLKESSLEAEKWKFHVQLMSVRNKMSVEFSGLVHPVDATVEEILKTGQYLLLNRQWVEQMKEMLPTEVDGYSSFIVIPFEIIKI